MIQFKQKEYIAPLVLAGNLAMGGLTAGQIIQSHGQAKEQKEQAEAMQQKMEEQNQALKRIAKSASKNPEAAQQAAEIIKQKNQSEYSADGRIKLFAMIPAGMRMKVGRMIAGNQTAKNAYGFAKDLGSAAWKRKDAMTSGMAMAASGAAAGYGANKIIQKDMERNGQPIPGTQAYNQQQKSYAMPAMVGTVANGIKNGAGNIWKNHKGSILMGGAMGTLPLLSYTAQKSQQSGQVQQTQQRSYANIGTVLSNFGKTARQGMWKLKAGQGIGSGLTRKLTTKPGQTVLGGISSMMGGGGQKGVNKFADELISSKNPWSQKTGQFLKDHKKTALAGSIVVGGTVMDKSWNAGEKAVKGTAKMLDKDAYAYENYQNQQVR